MPQTPAQTPAPFATFRDPAGSLSLQADSAVRTIHDSARSAVLTFLASPLRQRLETRGDMVSTEVQESPEALRLVHPRIAFPTYPWEWTPSQWLAAAELTLTLCQEALAEGWVLKDATPLNILFVGARPVLVDVLSFEPHVPGDSTWLAYAQYIRTFLLPLLMYRLLQWPLSLSLFKRDGYEPVDLYGALSFSQRFSPAAFFPITLPALLDRKKTSASPAVKPPALKDPGLAQHILQRTLAGLRKRTRKAVPGAASSEWANYTATLSHYTADESAEKLAFVREVLAELCPRHVLDIGANTGEFSALAASSGASVVALERDAAAAERLYLMSHSLSVGHPESEILTIHADLARPTPAIGWANAESSTLLSRLEGRFDLVFMLAVIHHLLLLEQIPLPRIVELLHTFTRSHLILEWVPVTDPMFQSLMRGRDSLYGHLSEADLLAACEGLFLSVRRQPLANGRILFLFEKNGFTTPRPESGSPPA